MKRLALAITIILALAGAALAQAPPDSGLWGGSFSVGKIQGVEVAPGTMDFEDSICWGKTFSMMNETTSLTIAPDYYFQPFSEPGEYLTKVSGGSWTLTHRGIKGVRVVQNGMLFGTVTGGTIEWYFDKAGNPTHGELELQVNITGGTGTFTYVGGPHTTGAFTGVVEYNGGFPVVTGTMELIY
jgi:hypothetical protein